MGEGGFRVLAIDPGSTSTKIGVYQDEHCLLERNIRHDEAQLRALTPENGDMLPQKGMRKALILEALREAGISPATLHAVAGRASRLPPMPSGTYLANDDMLADTPSPLLHPAQLGAVLALEIGGEQGIPGFFVDPTVVDEMSEEAHFTGIAGLRRTCIFHALNQKAVARRYAAGRGKRYEDCRLIVAHLGGGISVAAHRCGRVVDVTSPSNGEGPACPTRSGDVPAVPLIRMCFDGKHTERELIGLFSGSGGMLAHLGTSDLRECERRMDEGDRAAARFFCGMAHQIAKAIGAMAAALGGPPEAVLLTGGMARSERLVNRLQEQVGFLAPVLCYPGEDELLALAQGALRVLRGEERAIPYQSGKGE